MVKTIEEREIDLIKKINKINEGSLKLMNGIEIDPYGIARSKIITTREQIEDIYIASKRQCFISQIESMEEHECFFNRYFEIQARYYDIFSSKEELCAPLKWEINGILYKLAKEYFRIKNEIKDVFGEEEIVEIEPPYLDIEKLPYCTNYIMNTCNLERLKENNKRKYDKEREEWGTQNEKEWDGSVNIVLQNLVKKHFEIDIDLTGKVFERKLDFNAYFCNELKDKLFKPSDNPELERKRKYMREDIGKFTKEFSCELHFVFGSPRGNFTCTFPNTITKKDAIIYINDWLLNGHSTINVCDHKITTVEELKSLYEGLIVNNITECYNEYKNNQDFYFDFDCFNGYINKPSNEDYKYLLQRLTDKYNNIDLLFEGIVE